MDNNRDLRSTTTSVETTTSFITPKEVATTTTISTPRSCAAANTLTSSALVCFSPSSSATISPEPAESDENAITQNVQIQDIAAAESKRSHVSFPAMINGLDIAAPTSSGMALPQLSHAAVASPVNKNNKKNNTTDQVTSAVNESTTIVPSTSAAIVALSGDKDERPSLSYKDLIIEAIQSSREKRLKLSEIYQVIRELHPYYSRRADQWGWQNSIRHNLSLHDCFIKLPLKQTSASGVVGHFWTVVSETEEKQGSPTRRRSRANTSGSGKHAIGKHAKLRGVHNNHSNMINGAISGNSTAALNLNTTIGTRYGNSLVTQTSSAVVTNVFFNGTMTHPTSTPILSVGGASIMSTKIKGRQSVSSDSGVMSDESQSSSPTTSSSTTAANASNLLQQNNLLNELMLNGIPTTAAAAVGMINLTEQLQHPDSVGKTSSTMFACPSTSTNGISLRVHPQSANTSPDGKSTHHYNNLAAHFQQPQPQLTTNVRQFITPDEFQLLTSAISSISSPISLAQNQQQSSLLTTSSNSALAPLLSSIVNSEGSVRVNTNATAQAIAELFQQSSGGAQQLPVANNSSSCHTLTQFLEATCKNRSLTDIFQQQQQQQQQPQQPQSNGGNASEQLNVFLLPLLSAISANSSTKNASLIPPILNRVAALRNALGNSSPLNGISSLLTGNNASPDGTIGDLLTSSSLNNTTNLTNLSFLQYCAYQQSVIQQLLAENGTATPPTAGLLNFGTQTGQPAAQNDQIVTLLSQLQQQQQPLLSICQPTEQQQHNAHTLLRQLLANFSKNSLQHHTNSQQQQTALHPPASAPPAPLNAGNTGNINCADFGAILATASNNDLSSHGVENAGGDISSSHSPFSVKPAILPISTMPSAPQRQQLLDMFLMEKQQRKYASQQQHLNTIKNEIKDEPMDYEITIKTPLESDLQQNIRKASPNSLGDLQLQLEAVNHHNQQQKLVNSLIEQYILQNGARLSAASSIIGPTAASDATTEEVSTTTTAMVGAGGEISPHLSQSPRLTPYLPIRVPFTLPASSTSADTNFTANLIGATITVAAGTNTTTTAVSNASSQ